ncbi:hypothetical protein CEP54_012584 [Fusarium duplospermum]|uniref:Uncharacterized protein n=1 Tax=Fusarium duplospermum TaxID=1325734 RepID=A0A428P7X2_9HYPO|nr:hypothetical protein CEP54_012584 [Fusarium duplospermum]
MAATAYTVPFRRPARTLLQPRIRSWKPTEASRCSWTNPRGEHDSGAPGCDSVDEAAMMLTTNRRVSSARTSRQVPCPLLSSQNWAFVHIVLSCPTAAAWKPLTWPTVTAAGRLGMNPVFPWVLEAHTPESLPTAATSQVKPAAEQGTRSGEMRDTHINFQDGVRQEVGPS